MRSLNADDIILICERGHGQPAAERAITVLAAAFPEQPAEELRALSLGQRNALLLGVRERLFGPDLTCFSACPNCHERLEFRFSAAALQSSFTPQTKEMQFEIEAEGYTLRFRPLNSRDLQAAAGCESLSATRQLLVARALIEARREGEAVDVWKLPEEVISRLVAGLAECDPQAEMLVQTECPVCQARWQTPLDIAQFLYTAINAL